MANDVGVRAANCVAAARHHVCARTPLPALVWLQAWHPSDGSALVLLRPWHRVFDPADWDALLLRSIVPKLAMALQSLVINPAAQDMGPFNWVMAWHDVLPVQHMVALLDTGFFPKWHQVLHFWLSNRPNYDEVTRWYLGWKSSFPSSLLDQERVRRQFNAALDMMNQAVDGQAVPAPATGPASAFASRWASDGAQQEAAPPLPRPTLAGGAEPSLKDMVAHFAEENSIQFMPKFGRYQDGLQVSGCMGLGWVVTAHLIGEREVMGRCGCVQMRC